MNILPQITQMTQRNAAGLHYHAEKDSLFEVKAVLWFVCVNQRNLREILWFLVCRLIEYSHVNILPQIAQITQRGMQQAALFRRERQLGQMKQTTITAVLTEIKFRNKRKTASTAHVITENGH